MITPVTNAAGACVGITIDATTYNEVALLTLISRLARQDARVEAQDAIISDLRTQMNELIGLLADLTATKGGGEDG